MILSLIKAGQGYMGLLFVIVGVIGGLVGTYILSIKGGANYDTALKIFMNVAMAGCVISYDSLDFRSYSPYLSAKRTFPS
jgi:uncharacterized membrane protein YeaQ/YmgE (transglycosylase-associated protein family)